jgi:hypothetical protein
MRKMRRYETRIYRIITKMGKHKRFGFSPQVMILIV